MSFENLESGAIVIVLCWTVAPPTCTRNRSAVTAADAGFINARPVSADWSSKISGNRSRGWGLASSASAVKLCPRSRTRSPSKAVFGESTRSQPSMGTNNGRPTSSVELLLTDPNGGIEKFITEGALKDESTAPPFAPYSVTVTGIVELVGLVKTSVGSYPYVVKCGATRRVACWSTR